MPPTVPLPLFRGFVGLQSSVGVPSKVHLTTWGTPLTDADHVLFYFGGMPSSAEEPALHSLAANKEDVYKERKIHLICIDKPGMGKTPFQYRFSIRNDWPNIVDQVAKSYKVDKYGVFGVSNGGPYVMACLTHEKTKEQVSAAAMIVGVSDVWASGYFSFNHISGIMEGVYNSLPIVITGPLNYVMFSAGSLILSNSTFYNKVFDIPSMQNQASKDLIRTLLSDGVKTAGLGSAVDCQQGLSPLYAGKQESILNGYAAITCPVSLWYGTKDSSVPMASAEWLEGIIPHSKLYQRDTGHGLYFYHGEEVLDDLVQNLGSNS